MELKSEFIEQHYAFKGLWDVPSVCGLMVKPVGTKTLFVLTELYDQNPGTSVTNWIAPLAKRLMHEHNCQPDQSIVVVQVPDMQSKLNFFRQSFHQVSFDIADNGDFVPRWAEITKDELVQLIH